MVMQHIWNTLPNIYCHLELSSLHCIVVLCDWMVKRDSQVQGGRVAVIENELVAPYRFA